MALFERIGDLIERGLEELLLNRLTIHSEKAANNLRFALSFESWSLKSLELTQMFASSKYA